MGQLRERQYLRSKAASYQGPRDIRQYVPVERGQPAGDRLPGRCIGTDAAATVTLTDVRLRGYDRTAAAAASGAGEAAVTGISLQVPPGQSVALLGRADNTAVDLIDVVGGLRRPRSGHLSVDGVAVHRLSGPGLERYRADRGLVSARFPLLASLSVTDNVLAALHSRRIDATARERAAELMAVGGATHLAASPPDSLSAEDQWRILIVRALLPSPRLVLAEDPTAVLEPRSAATILDLIVDAHARLGFTLLLATSQLATAVRCQRLVSLSAGAITDDEPVGSDDPWTRGRVDRIG